MCSAKFSRRLIWKKLNKFDNETAANYFENVKTLWSNYMSEKIWQCRYFKPNLYLYVSLWEITRFQSGWLNIV